MVQQSEEHPFIPGLGEGPPAEPAPGAAVWTDKYEYLAPPGQQDDDLMDMAQECGKLNVRIERLEGLLKTEEMMCDEWEKVAQDVGRERDEARAAARKYLGPLDILPKDTREHVLRVHPWLKED